MKKGKVVIAQTLNNQLIEIASAIEGSELDVSYTNSPLEALNLSSNTETRVLISGQYFYIKTPLMGISCREYGNLYYGSELALRARRKNPELITLRYSATPEGNNGFCGDINKRDDFGVMGSNIAKLLKDERFWVATAEKDKTKLPDLDYAVWYLDNFPFSWTPRNKPEICII